ncbi:hypothetical protein PHLGIDRAFT_303822 [Phlebiopsis gigantea 11061_1 CR5-6]|uniref:Uncharacterized protein n=1 Tax=Phlebiopsis gigantea (strain 11061_1 CR5-6) TaxID=745531 RepID=A0A0C3PBG7_PHLG1|nr:hypothetical protein PHLGIDRAFT_303822 [Phlebiopsis gigantea 11061_1 CR5-6]
MPSVAVYPEPIMLLTQTEPVACPLGCGAMLAADTDAGSMVKHLSDAHEPLTNPPRTRALLCPCPGCTNKYEPQQREEWRTRTFARHLVQDHLDIVSYKCPAEGCSYKNKRSDEVNKHIKGKCYVNGVGIAEAV